jgi:DNA-binding MarR family transcriptional regulator
VRSYRRRDLLGTQTLWYPHDLVQRELDITRVEVEEFESAWERFVLAFRRARARHRDDEHLSLAQWDLLRPLLDHESLASGKLAEAAGITPATATGVLDGLEREGAIERVRCPQDRRRITIRLTPEGLARLEQKRRQIAGLRRQLLERLPSEDREQAARLLGDLAEVMESL